MADYALEANDGDDDATVDAGLEGKEGQSTGQEPTKNAHVDLQVPSDTDVESSHAEAVGDEYNKFFLVQLVVIASMGGFLFGYDTGVVSGAVLYLKHTWPAITEEEKEFVVSLAQAGASIAALLAGPLQDKLGRKPVIMIADVFFTVGALIMALAPSVGVLMLGRFVVGVGVGMASLVVPVYLAEVSPQEVRGAVVAIDIMIVTLGQFISSLICLMLGHHWRIMFGLAAVPSALQLFGMLFMPESQRWLARQNDEIKCKKVLRKVYPESKVEEQFEHLQKEVADLKDAMEMTEKQRLRELFTTYRRCLFVGCGLQFFQQFVGINTVMYYGPKIIIATGIKLPGFVDKDQMAIVLNIPLALVNVVGTAIAIFIIDGKGRRYTMLRTLPGQVSSLLVVAVCMYLSNFYDGFWHVFGNCLALISLIVYMGFFAIGFSSTVWSVNTEIYPIHLVSTATALATATNWLSNFIVSSTFLTIMATNTGKVIAFLLLAFFGVLAFAFIYFLLPETNDRPIPENVKNVLEGRIQESMKKQEQSQKRYGTELQHSERSQARSSFARSEA